jgi:hypothetical protein
MLRGAWLPEWLRGIDGEGTAALHACCAVVSQAVATVAYSPVDVACTRLYNQKRSSSGAGQFYGGILDCIAQTAHSEGLRGLYKGLGANCARQLAHGVPQFVLLEQCRRLFAQRKL